MNIALVPGTFFPHPGGAQVQIHNLANKLNEKKINVDCYLFENTNLISNNYRIIIFNKIILSLVFLLKYYLGLNLKFLLKIYLKNLITNKHYDLWHFNFINFKSLILIDCLKDLDQRVLVTFQGIDIQLNKEIDYGYRLDKKYERYLNIIIKRIDYFSCLSNTIKDDLLSLEVPKNKMSIIPNAVNIDKFKRYKKKDLNKKKINLITVARFSEKKKGFDLLPKVALKLIEAKINFSWCIIGKGTKNLLSHNIIKNNPQSFSIFDDLISFDETYLPDTKLIKKYSESDVYINLSRIESFGITFVEALASQIPIISFDTKGANEIIKDKYNGYIIRENNINYMSNIIIKMYKDPSLLNNLEEGIVNSCKEYDLNLVTNKFIDAYNNLKQQKTSLSI